MLRAAAKSTGVSSKATFSGVYWACRTGATSRLRPNMNSSAQPHTALSAGKSITSARWNVPSEALTSCETE